MKRLICLILILVFSISPISACSSVVSNTSFAFQRDSTVPANITIQTVNNVTTESKPGFIHSVVFNDGWAFGIGGADSNICNSIICAIGYAAHKYNTPQLMYLAAPFTWYTGGHFCLQYPGGVYYMTFVNGISVGNKHLSEGQYLVVPNDAKSVSTYRANDSFTALNQSSFAPGHHRYAIEYRTGIISILNFQNETINM